MSLYITIKQRFVKPIMYWREKMLRFNMSANAKNQAKDFIKQFKFKKLNSDERRLAKSYWRAKGFKLDNTYWHSYYKGATGRFMKEYVPHDIFCSQIAPILNQKTQWPALLDKNLYYTLFKEFEQPKLVVSNINGFYFYKEHLISKAEAIKQCTSCKNKLVIKPSIDSGGGFMVDVIPSSDKAKHTEEKWNLLFDTYSKDFVVQEFVEQSSILSKLNESSLNTLRIMSYLNDKGVHIISSVLRMGNPGSITDNFKRGGMACGIKDTGRLEEVGFFQDGRQVKSAFSGVVLREITIPNYDAVKLMVSALHKKVPYFKMISWDIGINKYDAPVLIEYNTYNQSTKIHQVVNGPLFGAFTDEILSLVRDS